MIVGPELAVLVHRFGEFRRKQFTPPECLEGLQDVNRTHNVSSYIRGCSIKWTSAKPRAKAYRADYNEIDSHYSRRVRWVRVATSAFAPMRKGCRLQIS